MKTIKVNNYKMKKIADKMAKKVGKIKKGEEGDYTFELFTMESNLLKIYRNHPDYKSRRVIEAINIFLLKIDAYLSDRIEYDFSRQLKEGNKAYLKALQMSCDPFYNEELKLVINEHYDLGSKNEVKDLFTDTIKCLIRIKESVELWVKKGGINGYFKFLENQIGNEVTGDRLDFTVRVDSEVVTGEIASTIEENNDKVNDENPNYLNKIKEEYPGIKPYAETKDIEWENQALNYLNNEDYKKAESLYKKLCLAQPKHHSGFEGLAEVYNKLGQGEKAEWFMKEALKRARAFLNDGSIDKEVIDMMEEKYENIKK